MDSCWICQLESAEVKRYSNYMAGKTSYSALTVQLVFDQLESSEHGLSPVEVQRRIKKYGRNTLTEKRPISAWHIYFAQFANSLIITLLIAAGLIFLVWYFGERERADLVEGGLIIGIVFLITLLGFAQEFRAERAVEALKKLLAFNATVIRLGRERVIPVQELVPGDIVILDEGEKIPADIRLTQVSELQINEASLTGESMPVKKLTEPVVPTSILGDQKNMVFSGTIITYGRGVGIVTAIGDATEIGKIAQAVREVKEEATPIQQRLDEISKVMGIAVFIISVVVFLIIMFGAEEFANQAIIARLLHSAIAAIALAVAAIPEGLPAVVTIALALGTQRMLKRNALIRKLNSIETLGSTDIICADKTGTLTKGEMTVRRLYTNSTSYLVSGSGYDTEGEITNLSGKSIEIEKIKTLLVAGVACNNAQLEDKGKIIGDPTEAALLVTAAKGRILFHGKRIHEIPFSSERKAMSVVIEEHGQKLLYSKGAPEIILNKCSRVLHHGKINILTDMEREKILDQTETMSRDALRTLGFAYKPLQHDSKDHRELESDLIFIGLQGMIDPARSEVKSLVSQCHSAGIRIIMITGDHAATAKAVAREIGIAGDVITGLEFSQLSDTSIRKTVLSTSVFARVNPDTKTKIVAALKSHGHIVAMTGDGVNDAPAVKTASIGIAMGITGTDVAKEASDMVLLDDQFATIVAAIEEGRGVFQNIRKFVVYLLSCNIGEVIVVFSAVTIFHHVPLTASMLLWVNLVTDGFPAVALGMDRAEKDILKMRPSEFQGEIVTAKMWVEMIVFGLLLAALVLTVYIMNIPEGEAEAKAAAFTAIVVYELVRVLQIRRQFHNNFWSNPWLWAAVIISFTLHLMLLFVPVFARLFGIAPIDGADWLTIIFGTIAMSLVFEGIRNWLNHWWIIKPYPQIKIAPS